MKRASLQAVALLALLACCSAACAAVFSRDWKTPGDGLLTYDDVNQREWLDLSQSRLSMFPGTTREERFQSALLELRPEGLFDRFTVAKGVDLAGLAKSAEIDPSSFNFMTNHIATSDLIRLVGPTVESPGPGNNFAIGLLDEITSINPVVRLKGHLFIIPESGPDGDAGLLLHPGLEPFQGPGLAIWLFRPVPEPSSVVTSALGFLGGTVLHHRAQRRRNKIEQLSACRGEGSRRGRFCVLAYLPHFA